MQLTLDWVIRSFFPVSIYHQGRSGRVLVMGGFSENLRLLHLVRRTDHLICFTVGDYLLHTYDTMRRVAHLFEISADRISVLCNYPKQVQMARAAGFSARLCNLNAFIDENLFRPRMMQKQFDAVCVARPVAWKRVPLARLVGNLAIVRGPEIGDADYEDIERVPHTYINEEQLSPRGVAHVLAASRVGLALSAAEGACFASSECLLSGLPVVSTPSRGGRDIWYDADNSVICEPRPEAVRDAVRHLVTRLNRRELDPLAIRERHLALTEEHRKAFVDLSSRAFDQVEGTDDPSEVFARSLASTGVFPAFRAYAELGRALSR